MTDEGVLNAWKQALNFWGSTPQLKDPRDVTEQSGADRNAIAYIQMTDRQVVYNRGWMVEHKVLDCLPAIFAHELAHHLRFPHTLKVSGELHLLGVSLIPGLPFSYLNIFWDLLVNQAVGENIEFREQLIKVYAASIAKQGQISDLFTHCLFIYECLWGIEGRFKLNVDPKWAPVLRRFAQEFYQLENFYDQFIFFLAHFVRFLEKPTSKPDMQGDPFFGDAISPDPGDYPIGGKATPAMKRALKKASEKKADDGEEGDGFAEVADSDYNTLQRALSLGPGNAAKRAQQGADLYYRALINEHIEALPKFLGVKAPELIVPTTLDAWEVGDESNRIDWQESISRLGESAAVGLLQRDFVEDDPSPDGETEQPQLEIYLDTSGSMPSPIADTNMMTLAALILGVYGIRRAGRVRGVIYSSGKPLVSEWMQSEEQVRKFFLQYIGGGTEFPFRQLHSHAQDNEKVFRVLISDGDFLYNVNSNLELHQQILSTAINRSKRFVMVLAHVEAAMLRETVGDKVFKAPKFAYVPVADFKDFAKVSAALARSLLGDT